MTDIPGNTYYDSLWNTPVNWAFETVPQTYINNTIMEWPRGKVLGGSSAINGLYLNRPAELEVNLWQDMLGAMPGAEYWSWDSLFAAMKKSETFTPPSASIAKEGDITWDSASHGTDGPIHMSWPGYTFPMVADWSPSASSAGVAVSNNTYGGQNWGAYVATSAINPSNWTRSYSRTGYLDPLPPRSNYDVLANAQVTRILFNSSSTGNLTASSVEYAPNGGSTTKSVKVGKEVILCGGTIGSPTVLLYSGVGPADVLSAAGVDLKLDLPVGQYLQDHLSVSTTWNTSDSTAASIYAAGGSEAASLTFLSYVNDAIAYVNASVLFGEDADSVQQSMLSSLDGFAPSDTTIAAGYSAITNATAKGLFATPVGQIELLIGNTQDSGISLGATLQHPLSLGTITINSSNPLDYPVINPNYLQNPADAQILIAGLKLARLIGQTEPLSSIMTEVWPGTDVQSDADWTQFILGAASTEFHPSSTCAMLPRDQGGVVDATLKVYGASNVRVADASVPPIEFSAHLMSSTYGLAEQASIIIKQEYGDSAESNITSTKGSGSSVVSQSNSGSKSNHHSGDIGLQKGLALASRPPRWALGVFLICLVMCI